ncbi:hypothetical protein, partial [Helicobacter sp. UBA3407]|uniref:hypothetical protein n=1 Tax=Helicobacter sp. UBA3407 TaxID=1946588 RepID=UPI00263203FD
MAFKTILLIGGFLLQQDRCASGNRGISLGSLLYICQVATGEGGIPMSQLQSESPMEGLTETKFG